MFRRCPGLPFLLRIFAVVIGGIIFAQAINFGILLVMPLSAPSVYAVSDIGEALRSGLDASSSLTIEFAEPPSEESQDSRDLQVRSLLAERLAVEQAVLRLNIARPPALFPHSRMFQSAEGPAAKPFESKRQKTTARSEMIVGGFRAAMRLADGQWRVVYPQGGGLETWQWRYLLSLLGTILGAAPVAWLLARQLAAPVALFSAAAEQLGRDPTGPPLVIAGPREIATAAAAFNEMQARIKRFVDDRTTMLAAIAHDLRTPLMRLSLIVEKAPHDIHMAAEAEIREMTGRIRDALSLVQDLTRPARRQLLDLRALVESVADEMADRGVSVVVDGAQDLTVNGDLAGLKALFANLIDNAVQYAGGARVTVATSDGLAIIVVADDGPGIPDDELEKVFQPFYRIESSRDRSTGGTGLGLASARSVARAHGGDVTLRNRTEGGIAATVALPLAS